MKTCDNCYYTTGLNTHCRTCTGPATEEKEEWEPRNKIHRFFFLIARKFKDWTKKKEPKKAWVPGRGTIEIGKELTEDRLYPLSPFRSVRVRLKAQKARKRKAKKKTRQK